MLLLGCRMALLVLWIRPVSSSASFFIGPKQRQFHASYSSPWTSTSGSPTFSSAALRVAVLARKQRLFRLQATERVTFTANVVAKSDTLVSLSTNEEKNVDVCSFFQSSHFLKNCLCSSSSNNHVEVLPLTDNYRQLWLAACSSSSGDVFKSYDADNLPALHKSSRCFVLVATPSTLQFPGLKVETTILNGIQLFTEPADADDSTIAALPIYKGILLAERRKVSGTPAAVWLFHKMMGKSSSESTSDVNDNDFRPSSSCKAVSTISLVAATPDGHYCVQTDSHVQVNFEFPILLKRVIPISMQKMQEVGSAAVQKAVSADIRAALNHTAAAYLEWQKQQGDSNNKKEKTATIPKPMFLHGTT